MYDLQVEGLSCGVCVRSVTKSVQVLDAGAIVDVDLASKTLCIVSRESIDSVKASNEDAGYVVVASTASKTDDLPPCERLGLSLVTPRKSSKISA